MWFESYDGLEGVEINDDDLIDAVKNQLCLDVFSEDELEEYAKAWAEANGYVKEGE